MKISHHHNWQIHRTAQDQRLHTVTVAINCFIFKNPKQKSVYVYEVLRVHICRTVDTAEARGLTCFSSGLLSLTLRKWWLTGTSPSPFPSLHCLFCFAEQGLDHIAENILSYLDARSLCAAELVCKEWQRVISEGMLWKKLIERMVRTDPLWKGLSERRGW